MVARILGYVRAISYLYWIVISIACSTRLEVFQSHKSKNIKKIATLFSTDPQIFFLYYPLDM